MANIKIIQGGFEQKLKLQFAPGIKAGFPSPAEVATLRKASTHIMRLRTAKTKTKSTKSRQEREATIVNMYNGGHAIDDIWAVSGFKNRSSIFRNLRKYGITLNRGPHSGPIKKWNEKKNPIIKEDKQ